jgi:hypothetical protein
MRRDLIYVRFRRFLLFGGLFLCFLFRHASMMAQFLSLGNSQLEWLNPN